MQIGSAQISHSAGPHPTLPALRPPLAVGENPYNDTGKPGGTAAQNALTAELQARGLNVTV